MLLFWPFSRFKWFVIPSLASFDRRIRMWQFRIFFQRNRIFCLMHEEQYTAEDTSEKRFLNEYFFGRHLYMFGLVKVKKWNIWKWPKRVADEAKDKVILMAWPWWSAGRRSNRCISKCKWDKRGQSHDFDTKLMSHVDHFSHLKKKETINIFRDL